MSTIKVSIFVILFSMTMFVSKKRTLLSASTSPVKRSKHQHSISLIDLPPEVLWLVLDHLPIFDLPGCQTPSGWCSLAATCRVLRDVVHARAEHTFLLHCGSQKKTCHASFLPQLMRTCQHHSMPLVTQLPLTIHASPCLRQGAHYAPRSLADAREYPEVWKKIFEDGLSKTIIQHLVPQLESTGYNLSINPHYDQTNDGEEYDLEGQGACALLIILSLKSGALLPCESEATPPPDTTGVAKAVLHTLSTCVNLIKPNNTRQYDLIGDAIYAFVDSRQHIDFDDPVTQAFGRLLTLFLFPLLVRTSLDGSVGDESDINVKDRSVATTSRAVGFLFDTFRRYDARSTMLPKFCLHKLKFNSITAGACAEKIAACPDLMRAPYYSDGSKTVLHLCSNPFVPDIICCYLRLMRSPWFELPKAVEELRLILSIITDCNSLHGLQHFCSLLPQSLFEQLPWGAFFIRERIHPHFERLFGIPKLPLSKWISVVSKYRPFHVWEESETVLHDLLCNKRITFVECKEFLQEHFHANLKGALRKAMDKFRSMKGKSRLVTFCSNLLKK